MNIKETVPPFSNVKQLSKAAQNEWKRFLNANDAYLDANAQILHQVFDKAIKKATGKTPQEATKIINQLSADAASAIIAFKNSTKFGTSFGADQYTITNFSFNLDK